MLVSKRSMRASSNSIVRLLNFGLKISKQKVSVETFNECLIELHCSVSTFFLSKSGNRKLVSKLSMSASSNSIVRLLNFGLKIRKQTV